MSRHIRHLRCDSLLSIHLIEFAGQKQRCFQQVLRHRFRLNRIRYSIPDNISTTDSGIQTLNIFRRSRLQLFPWFFSVGETYTLLCNTICTVRKEKEQNPKTTYQSIAHKYIPYLNFPKKHFVRSTVSFKGWIIVEGPRSGLLQEQILYKIFLSGETTMA